MLAISETTRDALEAYARPAFAARVQVALTARYPHILGLFPEDIQTRIVANMLGRATSWGLEWQSSLLAFCEFMLVAAPDFDTEPELRALLERDPQRRDTALLKLPERASKAAWDRAEKQASNLPLFISRELMTAALPDQTVAALPLVLFGQPEVDDPRGNMQRALPAVSQLGLNGLSDAAMVICACRSFWGASFTELAWIETLRREQLSPRVVLETLRCRLMLEFGRFV